jgi:hypothetical protein
MACEKAEKSDTREKKSEVRMAGGEGKVKETPKGKKIPERGNPTAAKT